MGIPEFGSVSPNTLNDETIKITENISPGEQWSHNQKAKQGKEGYKKEDLLSDADMRATNAFEFAVTEDQTGKELPTGEGVIVNKGTESKEFHPAIDLRELKDKEGIRNGLKHPALLNNPNEAYFYHFGNAVKGYLAPIGLLKRTEIMTDLRKDPSKVFANAFMTSSESHANQASGLSPEQYAEKIDKLKKQSDWEAKLANRISENPNGFLFKERALEQDFWHSGAIVYVRPTEEDTTLRVFTDEGFLEIQQEGLIGDELIDLAALLDTTIITYTTQQAIKNGQESFVRELADQELFSEPYEKDPEQNSKKELIAKLHEKVKNIKLVYKAGYDNTVFNTTQEELQQIKSAYELANNIPWPVKEEYLPKNDPPEEMPKIDLSTF